MLVEVGGVGGGSVSSVTCVKGRPLVGGLAAMSIEKSPFTRGGTGGVGEVDRESTWLGMGGASAIDSSFLRLSVLRLLTTLASCCGFVGVSPSSSSASVRAARSPGVSTVPAARVFLAAPRVGPPPAPVILLKV